MKLKDKSVIVTGARRGIGLAIAKAFSALGANVLLNHHGEAPQSLADEVAAKGGKCVLFRGDVAVYEEAQAMVKACKEAFGSVDVLVNNAGITRDNLMLRMTEDEFDSVIRTNLKGSFNMVKAASNVMLKQKSGSIINIASVVGLSGNVGQANYSASKAGLVGLTKSAAKELGQRGITVNAVAPGYIETDMTAVLSDQAKEAFLTQIPLKRPGTPDDVAEVVVFLAGASYITGQVVQVDGGLLM